MLSNTQQPRGARSTAALQIKPRRWAYSGRGSQTETSARADNARIVGIAGAISREAQTPGYPALRALARFSGRIPVSTGFADKSSIQLLSINWRGEILPFRARESRQSTTHSCSVTKSNAATEWFGPSAGRAAARAAAARPRGSHPLDFARPPGLVEPRLERPVEAKQRVPSLSGYGGDPVRLLPCRRGGGEIEID
jgi:hypothetical protein